MDEFHTIVGAGAAEGAIDAASILKPVLARGELQLIGATTNQEFRTHIQKDAALERRFGRVQIEEPTPEQTVDILEGLAPRYERYHGVRLPNEALREAVDGLSRESPRLAALRDRLIDGLTGLPYTRLTGDPVNRLPGTASFVFEGVEGEALLLHLDARGICASSGSACSSASLDPSHVLLAIGLPHAIAHGSLRLSLGAENTEADVDYILKEVPQVVAYLRELSPVWDRDAQKPTWEL